MKLVADTHKESLRLENLLTGESVENRSTKSQRNADRADFERTFQNRVKENAKALAEARKSNWDGDDENRTVHNGPIKHQFRHLIGTKNVVPRPDLKKRMNAKTLCERAEQIRKYGFPSHELCYWNCGDYRVRCDQIGSKDECIGPKLFVEINDPTECIQGGVHEFDVIATANHTIAFPEHLDRIRDRNAVAEQEKKEAASRKRTSSAWPKEAAKSSRVASRQLVDGAAAPTEHNPKRAGAHTAKQYRESTQLVKNASSPDALNVVLASVRATSRPTSITRQPKRPYSCSSQSKSAPTAKAATPWQPTLSQASSSRDGGHAASQQPDPQPTASDTSNHDWRASSSHLWDGGRAASQQPDLRSSYYQSDYKSAYYQSSVKSSWYKYERKNDTESGSDPWHNWKPSDQWKEKKW
jgi:hypothetical protein